MGVAGQPVSQDAAADWNIDGRLRRRSVPPVVARQSGSDGRRWLQAQRPWLVQWREHGLHARAWVLKDVYKETGSTSHRTARKEPDGQDQQGTGFRSGQDLALRVADDGVPQAAGDRRESVATLPGDLRAGADDRSAGTGVQGHGQHTRADPQAGIGHEGQHPAGRGDECAAGLARLLFQVGSCEASAHQVRAAPAAGHV